MSALFEKIRELGGAGKSEELESLIQKYDGDKLSDMMKTKLCDPSSHMVLNYLFKNLSKSKRGEITRFQVIQSVLKETGKQQLTAANFHSILMRITIELDLLSTQHLVSLTDYFVSQLQMEKPDSSCWKELLPKLMILLKDKPTVMHCGSELTGEEYKTQVVHALCMTDWHADVITMIANMFSEMQLNDEEMNQVMYKLFDGLASLEPSDVPPLVHQLLRVCKEQSCLILLMHVQRYFTTRLNPLCDETDTNLNHSMSVDTISRHSSAMETKQSEGMVLFHVRHFATFGEATIKSMLKTLRSLAHAPELIFGGNLLLPSALLMIVNLEPYNQSVLSLMCTSVSQAMQDEEHRGKNMWVRELLPSQSKLQSAMENIINETPTDRAMILESLVKLCFTLMSTKSRGRDKYVEEMWSLGSNVLLYLVKKNKDAIATVVNDLVHHIIPGKQVLQFLRSFQQMAVLMSRRLLQSQQFLSFYMVEQLAYPHSSVSEQIILSLMPLLQISESLCNTIVIELNKRLNQPDLEYRQMAVTGLLLLMQKMKIKRLGTGLSQNINSASSTYSNSQSTDITVHSSSAYNPVRNPEAMCLELMQLLRRCLTQHVEVKLRLYHGLLDVFVLNPEMSEPALQFLSLHLHSYICVDANNKCPLLLDKTEKEILEEDNMILTEPLGHLVFAVTQMLCHSVEWEDRKPWVEGVEEEIAGLAAKMEQCELPNFGFEGDDMTLEEGSKGTHKIITLTMVEGIYEALIAYSITRWSKSKNDGDILSKAVVSNFKTYTTFVEFHKGLKRPNKKKIADDTQGTQTAAPANAKKRGRPAGGSSALNTSTVTKGSNHVGGVTLPPVIDLACMELILNLLYDENLEWASEAHAGRVRSRLEFQSWAFNTLLRLLAHCKTVALNALMDKHSLTYQQLCSIGKVLYQKCICQLDNLADNLPESATLALEAFSTLLGYFTNDHKTLLSLFLASIGGGAGEDGDMSVVVGHIASKLQNFFKTLLAQANDGNDETLDASTKKLPRMLLSTLNQVCYLLKPEDPQLLNVLELLRDLTRTQEVKDGVVVKEILELLISGYATRSDSTNVLFVIARHVCHLTGTVDDEELTTKHKKLALIGEDHISVATHVLCTKLKELLEHLSIIINRLGYERKMVPYIVDKDKDQNDSEIRAKERQLCSHVVSVLEVLELLLSAAVTPELGDAVLRLVNHVYVTLTKLCKHFSVFSVKGVAAFRGTNFEKVVRISGKQLYSKVSSFINYIEVKNNEKYQEMQNKKKVTSIQVQRKMQRDSDCMARTVLEMERFSKAVFQLSTKTKIALKEHLNMGLSHDFRIDKKIVQTVLARLEEEKDDSESGDDDNSNADTIENDEDNTNMEVDDD